VHMDQEAFLVELSLAGVVVAYTDDAW
jgi:hypothetical protein